MAWSRMQTAYDMWTVGVYCDVARHEARTHTNWRFSYLTSLARMQWPHNALLFVREPHLSLAR